MIEEILNLDLLQRDIMLQAVELEKCRRAPWHWLTNYVWTLDSHDRKTPLRRFPNREYLKELVRIWQEEKLLLIPKSRQMMITWLMVALHLHDAQFYAGRCIFFQSKKEEDAAALIERAKFIYDHQPAWMKEPAQKKSCEIFFPEKNSRIKGIPQGADQIRSYTASGIFIDEAAFQPGAREAFTAAKPSIDGGGRITMVSSANPGFFETLVNDKV